MVKELKLSLAPVSDNIEVQLENQNLYLENVEKFEKIRFAINMLFVHSYINESQADKMRNKLFSSIAKCVKEK